MSEFLNALVRKCPPETPLRFIRFTWFGDYACSGGEHYFPGKKGPFEKVLQTVNKECSDDLIENLACWVLKNKVPPTPSLSEWKQLCFQLYELIKEDYLPDPVRYSPDYPRLFACRDDREYLDIIIRHDNCGGAMRSASLAYGGAGPHEHLALVGMTHLNPEALAGAYALFEAVRILREGGSIADMWDAGLEAVQKGEAQARNLIEAWLGAPPEKSRMESWMQNVRVHQEPAYGLTDWRAEGISTRFVVSAAMQIATEALPLGPYQALRHIVERGTEIGGDPDTLGSMGMALIGAHFGEELHQVIDRIITEMIPPDMIDPPEFLNPAAPT